MSRHSTEDRLLAKALSALEAGDAAAAIEPVKQLQLLSQNRHDRRAKRRAPQTVEELLPLLQNKAAAGQVLRQMRANLQLSQTQAGEICGVSHQAVAQWEGGRQAISREAIERLLAFYAERITDKAAAKGGFDAAALRALRKELGHDQMRMAREIGTSFSALRGMERGGREIPLVVIERCRALAAERGVDLRRRAA